MTPKDKANELMLSFAPFCDLRHNGGLDHNYKECALIAVNELIEEVLDLDRLKYWKEVKREIEKYETTSL